MEIAMHYQMLVLDIDGTLTNSKKEISPKTFDALMEIQKLGYKVVLASGRPTAGVRPFAEQLRLDMYGNYLLSFNGSKIINCKTQQTIYEKTLPQSVIASLYQDALEQKTGILSYENDTAIAGTEIDKYMAIEANLNHIPIQQVTDFPSYIQFPVNKCLMTAEPEHLAEVEQILKRKYNQLLNIYRSEPYFLELMPQGVDKAHSLQRLLTSLGLTAEEMICCGDGFNDISMLEYAGLGVAMENAQELVKSSANFITSSNDNDGILKVIQKFILKP